MRQYTLGTTLQALMSRSSNHRCRVEALEVGDVNSPGWDTELSEIELHVQELPVRERVARSDEYTPRQTHTGFGEMHEALTPGSRLVETHRRNEVGEWLAVDVDTEQRWQILGVMYLSGTPDPQTQVELHLHRLGPTR